MSGARLGFIGLGIMGLPMARRLLSSGRTLTVWNRSATALDALSDDRRARIASSAPEVFASSDVIILMLADEQAIDAVLGRPGHGFARNVAGRTIVQMGTTSPRYSAALSRDVQASGGSYVEAPVSGSRVPAERGELVAMLAGPAGAVGKVRPLLAPMCRSLVDCGAVPAALLTKLAVNIFLIATVTGLTEAFNFARQNRIDLQRFREVLDEGPMASAVSRMKLDKLMSGDKAPQASIADVLKNCSLIVDAAHAREIASPLLDRCRALYADALDAGYGEEDMVAVLHAFRHRLSLP
ncbi:MAG: NAD(P)-dependent oxidoreductase [Allosphingosinicella sp.]|uniref:NAD(P)-dependent oxidoreductase n=1 Tax=Allosphingosinicella sp. TaxID=2823234 RepID=UPI003955A1B4